MALTQQQKDEAKAKLRAELDILAKDTLSYWLGLFEATPELRKAFGYSRGTDDMLEKLVKEYRKRQNALMKPFDRGDFD